MKATPIKYTLLTMIAALCFVGCTKEDIAKNDTRVTEEQSDTPKTYSIYNYDYTGYEDECTGWSGHEAFVGQDYDNDGLTDRVYREYKEEADNCHYRIEFGNGDVIDMDKDVASRGFLDIKTADLNDDGQNEIIISLLYGTSTDMRGAGDMVVYEKQGGSYEKAVLPFKESDEGYSQNVPIHYEVVRDRRIQVSVEGGDYKTLVPIDFKQWDTLSYPHYYDKVTYDTVVWENYLLESDGKTQLVCKVHLFDKWCNYGLFAALRYENGKYIIEKWFRVNEEFENTIAEDSFWALQDYLLCSHTMQVGNQQVNIGLWITEGEYASEDELAAGGGVYAENFVGKYRLVLTDKDGEILCERDIMQDFDGMGGRLNFPDAFEIIDKDYNGDSRPDFTIGTYGSSAVNVYALYTVSEDNQIELIGKDIPNCSPAAFSVAFEQGGDKTFYAAMWDNTIGAEERIVYEWDEEQEMYREKDGDS